MKFLNGLLVSAVLTCAAAVAGEIPAVVAVDGLVSFWDFPKGADMLKDRAEHGYVLEEKNGGPMILEDGVFPGSVALDFSKKAWLMIPREKCPALNLTGDAEVTVIVWFQRQDDTTWQFLAGMWDEKNKMRQYGLFSCGTQQTDHTTMERTPIRNKVHGYISEVGGASPGKPFCYSYATGATTIPKKEWVMGAYTFDQKELRVYFNGEFDGNGNCNPLPWPKPIYNPREKGSDFTVGARAIPAWKGYPEQEVPVKNDGFTGLIGGVAVYKRALSPEEIRAAYAGTLGKKEQ